MIFTFTSAVFSAQDFSTYDESFSEKTKVDSIKTYSVNEIYVYDKSDLFDKVSSINVKRILLNEQLISISVGNLLASKPGIFTKSYGSEGSLQTISIRGAGSEYTSVIINGINLNNSLNGVFDFSKLSSDDISEIILKKGNDFDPLNNNSFGGVIELNPFEKNDSSKSSIKLQTGSFGYQSFQIKNSGSFLNSYYKISLNHKSAKNNYEYTFNNETGIRRNSDVNQNSLNLALINQLKIFNQPVRINSFIIYIDKDLGLPNFVSSNRHYDSGTREKEKSFSYSSNAKVFVADNIYLNGILGFNKNHLSIDDPLLSINLKTKYFNLRDNTFNSKLFLNIHFGKFFLTGGLTGIFEDFEKSEIQEQQLGTFENLKRKTFSSNVKVNFNNNLNENLIINSSLFISYNKISNNFHSEIEYYNFTNIRYGLSFNFKKLNFLAFGNAGKGIRTPNFYEYSFNKLTSLSGKKLAPEEIFSYEIGTRYEKEKLSVELIYFTFDVQNKIIWKPQRVAFFSPINSGRVKSSGLEISIENFKLSKNITLGANYTLTNALKKSKLSPTDNSFNKQLPYIPKHKASICFNFSTKILEVGFNSNYYSRRFVTEDNDLLFSLEPVVISNLSTTINKSISKFNFRINFLIQNLFNTSYQLIQSFPMPGREYRLTIQAEV